MLTTGLGVLLASCGASPLEMVPPDEGQPPAMDGAQPPAEDPDAFDLSGRWTSSGFEDPFEAELVHRGGVVTGQVCGPSWQSEGNLGGDNCGAVEAGWTTGDTFVHFDYTLPWRGLLSHPVSYQLVGSHDGGRAVISGLLVMGGGASHQIRFTRCPRDRRWCPEHR